MQFVPFCIAYCNKAMFCKLERKEKSIYCLGSSILCLHVVYREGNAFFFPLEELTLISICRLYVIC